MAETTQERGRPSPGVSTLVGRVPPISVGGRMLRGNDRGTVAKRIGRAQVESIVATATAVGGLVLGVQAVAVMVGQLQHEDALWNMLIGGAVFLSFLWAGVAAIIRRGRRAANGTFALVYLVALATWPLGAVAGNPVDDRPWLWLLCTVAAAAAAVAFPVIIAAGYTVVTSVLFGVISMMDAGGSSGLLTAILDTVYATLLGFGILILITMLRNAGDAVDRSQALALESYLTAVRQDATEAERLQVDALVHDSVLTTLLAAARSETPEQLRLVHRMAENALGHLHGADHPLRHGDEQAPVEALANAVTEAMAALSPRIIVVCVGMSTGIMPVAAAEALESAVVQAALNSLQHAGDGPEVTRRLDVRQSADGEIRLAFSDDGRGFDPAQVAPERIGLRVSIAERMEAIGGSLELDTAPGRGTRIVLRWMREVPA